MPASPGALDTTITKHLTARYLLVLPQGYEKTGKKWPLVLFLHGSGERGSDLEILKRQGLAIAHPDRFAALAVISGGGNPVEVCRLKNVPVRIVHGRKDDVIPVSWAEELGRRLERCSGNVRVTIYPDVGHDAWTQTYADPAFFEWLLAQRRPGR